MREREREGEGGRETEEREKATGEGRGRGRERERQLGLTSSGGVREQTDQYNKQEVNLASSDTEGIRGRELCYMVYVTNNTAPLQTHISTAYDPRMKNVQRCFFYPRLFLNQSAYMCYHSV